MPWLHHILNHFPIALSQLAAVVLVLALLRRTEVLAATSRWLVYLTAATAVPVALTGLLSAGHFAEEGGDATQMELHRNLALAGAGLSVLAAGLIWAGAKRARRGSTTLGHAATMGTAGLVAVAGHVGGDMLHPGLTPWSEEPHHHGPAERGGMESERANPDQAGTAERTIPLADATAPVASIAPQPSAQPSPVQPPPAPVTAPSPAVRPRSPISPVPKPKVPATAAPANHSGHQH